MVCRSSMIDNVFFFLYLLLCVCYVEDVVCILRYLIRKRPDTREMDRIFRAFVGFWLIAFLLLLLAYLWLKALVHFITNL